MHYSTVSYNKNNYFEQQILHTYIVHYTIHKLPSALKSE